MSFYDFMKKTFPIKHPVYKIPQENPTTKKRKTISGFRVGDRVEFYYNDTQISLIGTISVLYGFYCSVITDDGEYYYRPDMSLMRRV